MQLALAWCTVLTRHSPALSVEKQIRPPIRIRESSGVIFRLGGVWSQIASGSSGIWSSQQLSNRIWRIVATCSTSSWTTATSCTGAVWTELYKRMDCRGQSTPSNETWKNSGATMKSPGLRNLQRLRDQGEQSPIDSVEFAPKKSTEHLSGKSWNYSGHGIPEYPSNISSPEKHFGNFRRGPMVKGIRPRQAVERLKPNTQSTGIEWQGMGQVGKKWNPSFFCFPILKVRCRDSPPFWLKEIEQSKKWKSILHPPWLEWPFLPRCMGSFWWLPVDFVLPVTWWPVELSRNLVGLTGIWFQGPVALPPSPMRFSCIFVVATGQRLQKLGSQIDPAVPIFFWWCQFLLVASLKKDIFFPEGFWVCFPLTDVDPFWW